jgi:hypothetical protein
MMAANHFLNARPRFDDSSVHDQDIQALQLSFYTQSSCSFPQDNLQQLQQDQYYMNEQGSCLNDLNESSFSFRESTSLQANMYSFELGISNYAKTSHGGYYYDYTNSQNTDLFYNNTSDADACPRTLQQPYSPRTIEGYSISGPTSQCQLRDSHHSLPSTENPIGLYNRQDSVSRTPSLPDAGSCKAEDDGEEDTVSNTEESKAGEPYAKLIHRALMGAPSHSMALQEIYQWFIDNTEKGSSPSSGWRNSIRHNLSMNAVSHHRLYCFSSLLIYCSGFSQNGSHSNLPN